ncbi:hypothetical protein BDA99DRAFT_433720, partial [Phascolomyces articulosus]
ILHLCSCMNATENVRGINFRLTKVSPEQQQQYLASIVIEFDDRYNLLHHFAAPAPGQQNTTSSSRIHGPNALPPYRPSLIDPPTYRQSQQLVSSSPDHRLQFPSNTYHLNEKA